MTTDIASLGLDMNTQGLIRGNAELDRLRQKTDLAAMSATRLEQANARLQRQFSAIMGLAASLGGVLAGVFAVRHIIEYGDAWRQASNQIKLVTSDVGALKAGLAGVFQISQDTFTQFEANADLFARLNRYAGNLIQGQADALRLTKTIAEEVAIAGVNAQMATNGLIQFSQGLARGVLQGQDLKAVMEDIPTLGAAIARGMDIPLGKLKQMGEEGKLTSRAIIEALRKIAPEADREFSRVDHTVGQAFTKLKNSLIQLVGTAGSDLFAGLTSSISRLADALSSTGAVAGLTAALRQLMEIGGVVMKLLPALAAGFAAMTIVGTLGPMIAAFTSTLAAAGSVAGAFTAIEWGLVAALSNTEAAIGSVVAALGGPLAIAAGVAVGYLVYLATNSKTAGERISELGHRMNAAASEANNLKQQIHGTNEALARQAQLRLNAKMTELAEGVLKAAAAYSRAQEALDGFDEKQRKFGVRGGEAARRGLATEVSDRLKELDAARSIQKVFTDELKKPLVTLPTGLPGTIEEEDKAVRKAFESWLKHIDDVLEKIDQAKAERDQLLASIGSAESFARGAAAARMLTAEYDRQLDIQQEQAQLLGGPLSDAYKSMGAIGTQIARQDAERIVNARNQLGLVRQILKVDQDIARLPRLAGALTMSADEYDTLKAAFELLDRYPQLTEDAALAEARKAVAVQRTTDELERQAQRARELAEAPARNWLDGLVRLSDDFWTAWVEKGTGAFRDLDHAFRNLWKQLQADLLRKAFEPFLNQIRGAFGLGVSTMGGNIVVQMPPSVGGGAGAPGLGAGGSFLGNLLNFGGTAGGAGGGFDLSGLGGLLQMAAVSQGGSNLLGLGLLNQGGTLGGIAGLLVGRGQFGATLGGGINDIFNPANAIGGMLGSGLASILGLNGKNASTGGTLGGIAGSFFGGPIGAAIGSFIGQAIGSLIGPQPSDNGAIATLNRQGRMIGGVTGKPSAETSQAVTDAAKAVSDGEALIRKLGATLGKTIDGLLLGTRDPSRFNLTGSDAWISSGTTGDPKALVNAALRAVLESANFASPALQGVANAMLGAGKSFEETIDVLGQLADILPQTTEPLSKWGEALRKLDETFAQLRDSTDGVASAALDAAQAMARGALRDDFQKSISDALMQAREPLKKQFSDLLESQMQRVTDATRLGADLGDVLALNAEELKSFIENATTSADVFSDLTKQFADLRAQAAALGGDVGALDEAFARARTQIVSSFDDEVSKQIAQLSNPTLATLKGLLEGQKARLDQAKALGANITAVERLNALETQKFFEGLNDEQFRQLGNYLGLVEDFTGRIGATLVTLRDELDKSITGFDTRRKELERQQDLWRTGGQALLDLRQNLIDKYSDLSPQASLDDLRKRFGRLTEDARAGNESAIAALPQVAEQLVERSRELFGSTKDFRNDLDGVTRVLDEIGGGAVARADALQTQIDTLAQQRDVLIQIRDLLSQPDPQMDAIGAALAQLGEGNSSVVALLQQYLSLNAQAAAQMTPTGAIATAALNAAAPGAPTSSSYTPLPVGGAQVTAPTQGASTSPSNTIWSGDQIAAEAIGELTVVTQEEFARLRNELRDLRLASEKTFAVLQQA